MRRSRRPWRTRRLASCCSMSSWAGAVIADPRPAEVARSIAQPAHGRPAIVASVTGTEADPQVRSIKCASSSMPACWLHRPTPRQRPLPSSACSNGGDKQLAAAERGRPRTDPPARRLRAGVTHAERFVERHASAVLAAVFARSLHLEADGDFLCIGDASIGKGPLNADRQTPPAGRGSRENCRPLAARRASMQERSRSVALW